MLTQILNVLKILATVFPLLPVLIERFEVPETTGELKKQSVMEVLKALVDGLTQMGVQVPGSMVLTLCSVAIDALVAGYNAVGYFKKAADHA